MMERQLLLSLGLLDEAFNPGAGEDADFCLKALAMGLKSVQVPRDCDVWRTEFPIFHIGHMTCGSVPNWRDTAQRNTAILEDRYPRTEDDRQFQKAFSEGRQNVHLWSKAALQGVPSP
jgi:GT2 family glycosyltransferase